MAVPKRRTTSTRRDTRRAHWRGSPPTYGLCPQCRQPKLPHRVCGNCGYYRGRQAVEIEE
jgi:large subunit ribosomal protein L32